MLQVYSHVSDGRADLNGHARMRYSYASDMPTPSFQHLFTCTPKRQKQPRCTGHHPWVLLSHDVDHEEDTISTRATKTPKHSFLQLFSERGNVAQK